MAIELIVVACRDVVTTWVATVADAAWVAMVADAAWVAMVADALVLTALALAAALAADAVLAELADAAEVEDVDPKPELVEALVVDIAKLLDDEAEYEAEDAPKFDEEVLMKLEEVFKAAFDDSTRWREEELTVFPVLCVTTAPSFKFMSFESRNEDRSVLRLPIAPATANPATL